MADGKLELRVGRELVEGEAARDVVDGSGQCACVKLEARIFIWDKGSKLELFTDVEAFEGKGQVVEFGILTGKGDDGLACGTDSDINDPCVARSRDFK